MIGVKVIITNAQVPNLQAIVEEIVLGAQLAANEIKREEENVVAGWVNKPPITIARAGEEGITRFVIAPTGPNAKYWAFVSRGVPKHEIKAKNKPYMQFPSEPIPGSRPGGTWGGKYNRNRSGPWRRAKAVMHSIAPRSFEVHIVQRYYPTFQTRIREGFARGMSRAAQEAKNAV